MTVMTVKGRGYFCDWNLTLKNDFWHEINFANQKNFFLRKSIFANYRKSKFSREFNFANLQNSNFSREFNFANSRLIRETRETFFPRKFLPLKYSNWPGYQISAYTNNFDFLGRIFPKRAFASLRVPMIISYYIKLFCTGADRHNGICNKTKARKAFIDEGKSAY